MSYSAACKAGQRLQITTCQSGEKKLQMGITPGFIGIARGAIA